MIRFRYLCLILVVAALAGCNKTKTGFWQGKVFDAPAEIVDSRTMVPLRFIMEELGAQSVEWDADNYAVYIKTEN